MTGCWRWSKGVGWKLTGHGNTAENQGKKRCHGVEKGEDEERSQKSDVPGSASVQPTDEVTFEERGQVQGVVS